MEKTTPHPYVPSPGPLVQTFNQFKNAMPQNIDATTLKKLSLAPNNEAPVLSLMRFLGFIDNTGKKTPIAASVFKQHGDQAFAQALEGVVKKAYADLFEHYGEEAWTKDRDSLISFFRATDETSAITGTRQAVAFETLAALAGHGEVTEPKSTSKKNDKSAPKKVKKKKATEDKNGIIEKPTLLGSNSGESNVGLTVRIEINLPAQGDQETYDRIFTSIKKNLLNG